MSTWWFGMPLLDKYCLASESSNIHDPYAFVVVENNDTPIDTTLSYSIKMFAFKTFASYREILGSFHPQKLPAIRYGMSSRVLIGRWQVCVHWTYCYDLAKWEEALCSNIARGAPPPSCRRRRCKIARAVHMLLWCVMACFGFFKQVCATKVAQSGIPYICSIMLHSIGGTATGIWQTALHVHVNEKSNLNHADVLWTLLQCYTDWYHTHALVPWTIPLYIRKLSSRKNFDDHLQ